MLSHITDDVVHQLRLAPLRSFKNIQEAQDAYKTKFPVTVVYALFANNSIYVGSTSNIKARLIKHQSDYRVHYGIHPKLHKLFDAVGIDSVKVFIYEEDAGTDLDQIIYGGKLNTKARLLEIAYMMTFMQYGLNVISSDTYFNREEMNKKISASNMGVPRLACRIPVRQYSLEGDLLAEYESIKIAAEQTGVDKSSIAKCSLQKASHAGGFVWKR